MPSTFAPKDLWACSRHWSIPLLVRKILWWPEYGSIQLCLNIWFSLSVLLVLFSLFYFSMSQLHGRSVTILTSTHTGPLIWFPKLHIKYRFCQPPPPPPPPLLACLLAFLFKYIFRQFTGLFKIERGIEKAIKTFFFELVLERLQAQGEGPSLNKLPKRWIIHTKFKTCFK